jgi:hypothetical protein
MWLTGLTWKDFKNGITYSNGKTGGLNKVELENKIRKLFILDNAFDFTPFWDDFDKNTSYCNYQTFYKSVIDDEVNDCISRHIQNCFLAWQNLDTILNENLGTQHDKVAYGSTTATEGSTSTNNWNEKTSFAEDDNMKKRLAMYDILMVEFHKIMREVKEYLYLENQWKGDYNESGK